MKKWLLGVVALLTMVGIVGCEWSDSQVKVLSQNAGLAAAVTWIAYDNPDTNSIVVVKEIINTIAAQAENVQTGMTYTAVIYPEIQNIIDGDSIPAQYKPIALAGSLAVLNGIDLLFAMNPSWKEKEGRTLMAAQSFCIGAKMGLSLSDRDPIIIQARTFADSRSKILK